MFPVRAERRVEQIPLVTYTLVALNVIVFLWDRQGHLLAGNLNFSDLAMQPRLVVDAIRGPDKTPLITVFTSMFLHGNLTHILGNMIFLVVFGTSVEAALGSVRFTLYYLAWGIVAAFTQIWVDPGSVTPTLGASGAIGGVLGAYFLLFPSSKIEIIVPILAFLAFEVSAWVLLGLWFLYQILAPQEGVANWAHAGGFLAGMVTVLIMGGPRAILGNRTGPPGAYSTPLDTL
jgi:membrane associated rhomboid family serine protease